MTDAAAGDAASPSCDPTVEFGAPQPVAGMFDPVLVHGPPRLSSDELAIYFSTGQPGASTDLYTATRAATGVSFDKPQLLAVVNSAAADNNPVVRRDDKTQVETLWFESNRDPSRGYDVYFATRVSASVSFTAATPAAVNGAGTTDDVQPFVTADGQELWFASIRRGGTAARDLWHATVGADGFKDPVLAASLSSDTTHDQVPVLSADRRTIYFTRDGDIWTSHRVAVPDDFPPPTRLTGLLNTTAVEYPGWISADDCRLYGVSDGQIFVATRPFRAAP
jgi:hypothetical protein